MLFRSKPLTPVLYSTREGGELYGAIFVVPETPPKQHRKIRQKPRLCGRTERGVTKITAVKRLGRFPTIASAHSLGIFPVRACANSNPIAVPNFTAVIFVQKERLPLVDHH